MGIALNLVAIHISAGVTLIGVADDELGVGFCFGQKVPLVAGKKAGAASAPQPRGLDLLDHRFRMTVDENFVERLVATHADVLFDVLRVDKPAIAQNDLLLPVEERHSVPHRYLRISLAVANLPCNVIPLFDLAVDELGRHGVTRDALQDARSILRTNMPQHQQRRTGSANSHQRFLVARAEAADTSQKDLLSAAANGIVKRVEQLFGAVAAAACPHAYRDPGSGWKKLGKTGFAHGVEVTEILDTRHQSLPCLRILTSRCSVRSFTWLRM